MEEISALAAAETIAVLYNTEATMVIKIPYKLLKSLEDKASEYSETITLKENVSLNEQTISDEARSILLILYREFWCDSTKKQELDEKIINTSKEFENEELKRLDPFKDSKAKISTTENNIQNEIEQPIENISTSLIEVPKKWYVKIFDKIMRFFRKK